MACRVQYFLFLSSEGGTDLCASITGTLPTQAATLLWGTMGFRGYKSSSTSWCLLPSILSREERSVVTEGMGRRSRKYRAETRETNV